jgi:shikimate kinase
MKNNTDEFIMDQIGVEDSHKKKVFGPGAAKDQIIGGRDSGNVFILCLNDDLRDEIAEALSQKLDKNFVKISRKDGTPAIIATAEKNNQIVSLPRGAALASKNREILKNNGKVLFIMCDFASLLKATDGSEEARSEITILINRFEPNFMNTAHHIIRGDQSLEEMVQDALEKIAI